MECLCVCVVFVTHSIKACYSAYKNIRIRLICEVFLKDCHFISAFRIIADYYLCYNFTSRHKYDLDYKNAEIFKLVQE